MNRIAIPAAAALVALPLAAPAQDMSGCWRDTDPEVGSTVCFEPGGGATFSLFWALDDGSGWTEGRCAGYATVTEHTGNNLDWEVPRQERACLQDGDWDRLARRFYDCELMGGEFKCTVHVYLDDGSEWGDPVSGVIYERQ